jgi:hypothetical protein
MAQHMGKQDAEGWHGCMCLSHVKALALHPWSSMPACHVANSMAQYMPICHVFAKRAALQVEGAMIGGKCSNCLN